MHLETVGSGGASCCAGPCGGTAGPQGARDGSGETGNECFAAGPCPPPGPPELDAGLRSVCGALAPGTGHWEVSCGPWLQMGAVAQRGPS